MPALEDGFAPEPDMIGRTALSRPPEAEPKAVSQTTAEESEGESAGEPAGEPEPIEKQAPGLDLEPEGEAAFKTPPTPPEGGGQPIALTFDDGPGEYTDWILNILSENNARATFCVQGGRIAGYAQTAQKAIAQGCEIIGHSWNHKKISRLSSAEIIKDLRDTDDAIYSVTGIRPRMYRPPYGTVNDKLKNVSRDLGLAVLIWSVDPEDWKTRDADAVYNAIMRDVKGGSIIICHDIYQSTAQAMERVIPVLVSCGFELVTVSELLGEAEPGRVYTKGKIPPIY
jgi:peptidoglycan/xylan/chitin deacetylase (PgdA/CDA1 family)